MKMIPYISVSLFSPGQIVAIVLVSVLIAALIGLNIYLGYLLRKRVAHLMRTEQLQLQRNELMRRLAAMHSGLIVPSSEPEAESLPQTEEEEEPDEDSDEGEFLEVDGEEFGDGEAMDVEVDAAGGVVRYNRSFTARLTQADGDLKARYSELKNYLLTYRGVKPRMSWRKETFVIGRRSVAAFIIRGKTLCLQLATDPTIFDGTKYKVEDVSGKNNAALACMYRLNGDRKVSWAKELIDIVMVGFNTSKLSDYKPADYTLPYKSTEVLIKRRLIKVIGEVPDIAREDAVAAAKGIHYNRSFAARIIQSDDALKSIYSKLKNRILEYKDVVPADSWKRETFKKGRTCLAAFMIRGKTLCLCLATDPTKFDGTKYKVEDLSKRSKNTNTPLLYRVKSDRKVMYAMQLIDLVFAEYEVAKKEENEIEVIDFAVPFVATETLVRRGLIKVTEGAASRFPRAVATAAAEKNVAEESAAEVASAVTAETSGSSDGNAAQAETEKSE